MTTTYGAPIARQCRTNPIQYKYDPNIPILQQLISNMNTAICGKYITPTLHNKQQKYFETGITAPKPPSYICTHVITHHTIMTYTAPPEGYKQ